MLVRRLAVVVAGLALAGPLAACSKNHGRVSPFVLDRDFGRAFRRSFDARYRIETGVARVANVRRAQVGCHPLEPLPGGDREWRWRCRVRYVERGARARVAVYSVAVDRYGCFVGTTADFPARVHDAVLGGTSPNPLARIRSCP